LWFLRKVDVEQYDGSFCTHVYIYVCSNRRCKLFLLNDDFKIFKHEMLRDDRVRCSKIEHVISSCLNGPSGRACQRYFAMRWVVKRGFPHGDKIFINIIIIIIITVRARPTGTKHTIENECSTVHMKRDNNVIVCCKWRAQTKNQWTRAKFVRNEIQFFRWTSR